MGILNVTPDSFSDGGKYFSKDRAIERVMKMIKEGADIIDVGGESTRPGSLPVRAEEEMERVIPVIKAIIKEKKIPLSIDTTKAVVAEEAMKAGASIINDISALTADTGMVAVAKKYRAGLILMHMKGTPQTMQDNPVYKDVVREVGIYLKKRMKDLKEAGLDLNVMAIDPGIGFGKTLEHNLLLLNGISNFAKTGRPVVVGVSRKSFIGKVTGAGVNERLGGSIAAMLYVVERGASVVRVHDIKESRQALDIYQALKEKEK